MSGWRCLMVAAAVGIAQAGGIAAQTNHAPYFGDPDRPRQKVEIDAVAACFAKQGPRQADALLTSPLLSKEEFKRGQILTSAHNACIHGWVSLSVPLPVLRGAIAQQRLIEQPMLLEKVAALPARQLGRVPAVDGRPFIVAYATCVAVANPAAAVRLLRSARNTAVERSAFLGFADGLKNCMPEGVNYHVNIPALRDEVSSIAYLMAVRSREGA